MLLLSLPSFLEILGFFMVSVIVAGILNVQMTISHFPMPVLEGVPMA